MDVKRSLILLALSLWLTACGSPHPEEAAVLTALDRTVDALKRSDFDALWALTDQDTRDELLALLTTVHEAMALVPEVYPDDARRAEARRVLGEPILGSVFADEERAGPRLLSRILATDLMQRDQSAMDGVNNRDVTVAASSQPLRAIVHTSGGESFAFVKTDRGWRSLLVRDLVLDSLAIRELRDNAGKIAAARADQVQAWRTSKDPRTPQGAYNIARTAAAASPRDGALLYSLLDADSRRVLVDALEASRVVQRAIQKRTTRKQRKRAYEAASLTLYVKATSDRDLYERWVASDAWSSPLAASDAPASVDGEPASGAVTLRTDSGATVQMSRGDDGFWRPTGQAPKLAKALLEPVLSQPQR